jgi:hypothetical protein
VPQPTSSTRLWARCRKIAAATRPSHPRSFAPRTVGQQTAGVSYTRCIFVTVATGALGRHTQSVPYLIVARVPILFGPVRPISFQLGGLRRPPLVPHVVRTRPPGSLFAPLLRRPMDTGRARLARQRQHPPQSRLRQLKLPAELHHGSRLRPLSMSTCSGGGKRFYFPTLVITGKVIDSLRYCWK